MSAGMDWETLQPLRYATIRRSGRYLVVDLHRPHQVLSTSVRNGGATTHVRHLVNHQSCEGTAHDARFRVITAHGQEAYHDAVCGEIALPPEATATMGTAANMNYAVVKTLRDSGVTVTAVVTAGVASNATCAGDPASWRETVRGMEKIAPAPAASALGPGAGASRAPDAAAAPVRGSAAAAAGAAATDRSGGGDADAGAGADVGAGDSAVSDCPVESGKARAFVGGTINTLLIVDTPLTPAALARTLVTMVEGKSAALQRLAVPSCYSQDLATGTGTDQFCIAAPLDLPGAVSDDGDTAPADAATGHAAVAAASVASSPAASNSVVSAAAASAAAAADAASNAASGAESSGLMADDVDRPSIVTAASPHMKFGEMVGCVVRDATLEALRWQNGLEPSYTRGLFHALSRYGFKLETIFDALADRLDPVDLELLRKNSNAAFYEPLVGAAAHALATLLDRVRHGTLPPSAAPDAVVQQAALLAAGMAARPERWAEFRVRLLDAAREIRAAHGGAEITRESIAAQARPLILAAIALGWSEKWRQP